MIVEKYAVEDLVVVKPSSFNPDIEYPLVVHAHGVGGRPGLDAIVAGELPKAIQEATDKFNFIAIAPHTTGDWTTKDVDDAVRFAHEQFRINPNKRYLLGLSLGGGCVTKHGSDGNAVYSFAAYVSVCGLNWLSSSFVAAGRGAPWLFFHAQDDITVSVNQTHAAVSAINGQIPIIPAKKTIYPTGQHWIWGKVYSHTSSPWMGAETPPTLWDYLFMNEVGKPVAVPEREGGPTTVTAVAGADFTTSSPEIVLDGSASKGFKTGTDCSWSVLEVPTGQDPYSIFYKGSGYVRVVARLGMTGKYRFMLAVTGVDSTGRKIVVTDEVVVTYGEITKPPEPVWTPTHTIERKDGSKESVIIKTI